MAVKRGGVSRMESSAFYPLSSSDFDASNHFEAPKGVYDAWHGVNEASFESEWRRFSQERLSVKWQATRGQRMRGMERTERTRERGSLYFLA